MDVATLSVAGTERQSDDSDVEVIACYRHVRVRAKGAVAGRQMTTDLYSCASDDLPEFPQADFEKFWSEAL